MQDTIRFIGRDEIGRGIPRIAGHLVGSHPDFGQRAWLDDHQVMIRGVFIGEDNLHRLSDRYRNC